MSRQRNDNLSAGTKFFCSSTHTVTYVSAVKPLTVDGIVPERTPICARSNSLGETTAEAREGQRFAKESLATSREKAAAYRRLVKNPMGFSGPVMPLPARDSDVRSVNPPK